MSERSIFFLFFVGLLMVMGSVGGMDTCTDAELLKLLGTAVTGLLMMFAATLGMQQAKDFG